MSDLMLRAKADLRVAKHLLDSKDAYDIQLGAYHTQQAIVKAINVVNQITIPGYPHIADIDEALWGCSELEHYVGIRVFSQLREELPTLKEWEYATRYRDGYSVEFAKAHYIFGLAATVIGCVNAIEGGAQRD